MEFIKPDNPFQNKALLSELQIGDYFFLKCGLCRVESKVDGLRALKIRLLTVDKIFIVPDSIQCQKPITRG